MGCGRVGSLLATQLDEVGHSVAIIDQNREAFQRLPDSYQGSTILGVGFDKQILLEAGIERAHAFVSVSGGDNSNIISARLARTVFQVPRVIARIYDQQRAAIYNRLGIPTIAPVAWTAHEITKQLFDEPLEPLEHPSPSPEAL